MKKYELIEEPGTHLKRIIALRDIPEIGVKAGDRGGLIESETNLSHDGASWVFGNAQVYGDAKVFGAAIISGNAIVYDTAIVSGNARVFGNARVYDNAQVFGNARVYDNAKIGGDAKVIG